MARIPIKSDQEPQPQQRSEGARQASHEHYSELCALATTGTLSDREWGELKAHLSQCRECSESLQKYRELARTAMPLLITESVIGDQSEQETWTPEGAKQELLSRLARGDRAGWVHDTAVPPQRVERSLWRRLEVGSWQVALRYAAVLVLLAATTGSVYRFGISKGRELAGPSAASSPSGNSVLRGQVDELTQEKAALEERTGARDRDIAVLSKQLESASADLEKLRTSETQKQRKFERQDAELSEAHAETASVAAERDAGARKLSDAESSLAVTKASLERLREERASELLRTASLETRIADLSARVKKQGEMGAEDAQLLASDRDIRELMGARSLYIADVFDVGPSGRTEKPFGRIFYTSGKSLIFYAFDLDQQHRARNASAFQAWGKQGRQDNHPVNMGIFYLDNEANKRWVLKFDDPETLARIDTIFVTVEPRGGSERPQGKALLVASLRSQPPNHP